MTKQNPNNEIEYFSQKIKSYLKELCVTISDRSVGSRGNQAATEFFAKTIQSFGFATDSPEFECIDWTHGEVYLKADRESFKAFVSPYSLGCDLVAPLVEASTKNELVKRDIHKKILLLHGELAREQMMPKGFPFFNPEDHQRIIAALEQEKPAAIIAVTGRNPELVGALYPFPLFEDGDFNIPSVFMMDIEGERLIKHLNENIILRFESSRIPSKGSNVIATKGSNFNSRVVFLAHIDARKGTPGALDDGGGIATLLALAELLMERNPSTGIEIIAFNGEDYYCAPGQQQYLARNKTTLEQVSVAINLDDVGYINGRTSVSFYECPDTILNLIRHALNSRLDFFEGDQWYQGDHMIFLQNKIPAVAFTSEKLKILSRDIVHTPKDTVDLIDYRKLAEIAFILRDIAVGIGKGFQ
jgi:aminopeptidase YwaD